MELTLSTSLFFISVDIKGGITMKKSKILGAVVILSLGVVLAGCEEEHHHGHRPPPPPHHEHRHPEHHGHHHLHHHWRGRYRAVAQNNLSTAKGTQINLEIVEVNGELYLLDPLDRMFRFHVQNDDTAKVAGGYLKKENGQFIYKDVKGGIWLVEKDR